MSKRRKFNFGKAIKVLVVCILVAAITGASVLGFNIYKNTAVFDAEKLLSSGATQLYDANGELMFTLGNDETGKRKNVEYDDLPQVLIDAVVAAEDSRFFEHDGFDLPRIVKAAITNIAAGRIRGGGSTITQQLIKKAYFPEAERTYTRKISEIFLAIEADKAISKEEIITLYLNRIYFGRTPDTIGISAACKYYFNKEVGQLTLPEAALLAGSLNSPYNYDPYYNLRRATERRNTILNLMLLHGYITEEECELAKQTKIENQLCQPTTSTASSLGVYVDAVVNEVKERTGLDPKSTQMNIYTYCDTETQELATNLGNGEGYTYSDEDMQMGGCVQSSQDGRIVALIGGRNYQTGFYDYSSAKQQPGSAVKPFLDYGLAFENLDWCTGHSIDDSEYEVAGYSPRNWDRKYHGLVTIENALQNSWNVPAVKTFHEVLQKIGNSEVVKAMESIGINMDNEENSLSSAIGGWSRGISPREMASAYATISNNGFYTEAHTINYIEIVQTGEIIKVDEQIQKDAKQSSFSEESAYMVRKVMTDYAKKGSGSYAYLSGIKGIGAKTGTSNWDSSKGNGMAGKSRDIWMNGYNSDYICSVWMGFGKTGIDKGKTTSTYKAYPGRVVGTILRHLQSKGSQKSYPKKPSSLVEATIVKGIYPYVLPADSTSDDMKITALFKKGTVPTKTFDPKEFELHKLDSFEVEEKNGKLSYKFTPYDPIEATTDEKTNSATRLFGKVVYTVVVYDKSGDEISKKSYSKDSGTINVKVENGMKVVGYYSYEKGAALTSNKIEVELSTEKPITAINSVISSDSDPIIKNNAKISDTSVKVFVIPASDSNTVTIILSDQSGNILSSSNNTAVSFSNLTPGHSYLIKIIESNDSHTVEQSTKFSIK